MWMKRPEALLEVALMEYFTVQGATALEQAVHRKMGLKQAAMKSEQ